MVVELIEQSLEGAPEVCEVHYPTGLTSRLSGDMHLDAERMTVHPRALVPFGHVGQEMGGFYLEDTKDIHAAIVTLNMQSRKSGRLDQDNRFGINTVMALCDR